MENKIIVPQYVANNTSFDLLDVINNFKNVQHLAERYITSKTNLTPSKWVHMKHRGMKGIHKASLIFAIVNHSDYVNPHTININNTYYN